MLAEGFRLSEPVAIPPVQVPEPVEEDFQQKEIFSLLKEATDLRRQQQRLEMQISQAQDLLASWDQGLYHRWFRLRHQEGDAVWPEDRLEKGEADVSTAAPLEGSEVLITSQLTLAREAHEAALRLCEAEAAVSTLQADSEALEQQSRQIEEEVQEMAGPLKELEALREEGSRRAERLEALKSREEATLQALAELSTKRLALEEAAGKLQEELQETSAKELPQVAKRRREADLEDRRENFGAKNRWKTEVQMCQSALQAEEKQLARLLARKESTALAAGEGQQACSVLSRSLADVRQEHARLLGWKQEPLLWAVTDRPFGFALDLSSAAGRLHNMSYFDAEKAEELKSWLAALEGWIAAAKWQVGDVVCVTESFMSDSEDQVKLEPDMTGILVKLDEHDDAFLENRHKLKRLADSGAKDVFLDIVPQNDIIMHWALRVVGAKASRCYEFEADGVIMGKRTALDKGLPISSQKLEGRTAKTHREISQWCTQFGADHSYDAAGNNIFGGKNCQDFAVELCTYMGIDKEQLPFRQAEQVKTVLGAGAFVAADAALGTGLVAAGTGLVAGALDLGIGVAGAAAGAAMSPGVLAAAAAVGVGYASGVITAESIPTFGFESEKPEQSPKATEQSLQLDIERLKGEVGAAEAELRKARAHEAATVEADRLRTVVLSSELTAFQVCSERLFRLSRNMEDKTESLQSELQRELVSANDLRQTLMAAFEANVSEVGRDLVTAVSKPLLHSESAPELNPRPAPATWKDVMERHGCPPEQSISVRMHRRRKKQSSTPAGAPQRTRRNHSQAVSGRCRCLPAVPSDVSRPKCLQLHLRLHRKLPAALCGLWMRAA
eukprot:s1413_g4.t1